MSKTPYKLIDGETETVVCSYRALTIALRDCGEKNRVAKAYRFYVQLPSGRKQTVKEA